MRFHANENIEAEVVTYLRSRGFDVTWAAEIQPRATDEEVLRQSTAEDRILITADKDFGEMCFRQGLPASGVVLLRARDPRAAAKIRLLGELLQPSGPSGTGVFIVLSEGRTRIHPLVPPRQRDVP